MRSNQPVQDKPTKTRNPSNTSNKENIPQNKTITRTNSQLASKKSIQPAQNFMNRSSTPSHAHSTHTSSPGTNPNTLGEIAMSQDREYCLFGGKDAGIDMCEYLLESGQKYKTAPIKSDDLAPPRVDRCAELYRLSRERMDRQAELAAYALHQHPFRPEINALSNAIVQSTFEQRLLADLQRRREVVEEREKLRLFTSKPNKASKRTPKGERTPDHQPGEYLYKKALIRVEMKKQIEQDIERDLSRTMNASKISGNSLMMADTAVNDRIHNLYEMLDSDKDGLISAGKIDLENISPERLNILAPLLVEMEEKDISLSEQDFTTAMKLLLQLISIEEKRTLLGLHPRKRSQPSEPSFHPRISDTSRRLAERRRHSRDNSANVPSSVQSISQQRKSYSQKRHDDMVNELKVREEMLDRECTFHPRTNSVPRGSRSTHRPSLSTVFQDRLDSAGRKYDRIVAQVMYRPLGKGK